MSKPWIRSFSSPGPTGLRELGDIAQNRGGAADCTLEIILKNSTDGLHLEAVESWHHFGFRVVLHLDGCYMMGNMLKHILGMGKWYEMMVYRWEMWSFCGLTGWLSSEQISTDSVTADRMVRVAAAPSNSNPFHTYMPSLCDGGNGKNGWFRQQNRERNWLLHLRIAERRGSPSFFWMLSYISMVFLNGFWSETIQLLGVAMVGSRRGLRPIPRTDPRHLCRPPESNIVRRRHGTQRDGEWRRGMRWYTLEPTWTNLNQQRLFRFPTPQNKINKSCEHGYLPRIFWLAVYQDHFRI